MVFIFIVMFVPGGIVAGLGRWAKLLNFKHVAVARSKPAEDAP